jgi:hydroxyacyl-ACP dehydratase HTD2-like protein with hotdog domain
MSNIDLNAWLGKSQVFHDRMDPGHASRIATTLSEVVPGQGDTLPALWHWAYFLESIPLDMLGMDGHPARGAFLPPADNRNRMWAGGRVEFLAGADILFLDEISEGLAPVIVEKLGQVIDTLKKRGYTILLVEQNFEFASELADRLYVIEHGQVVYHLTAAQVETKQQELKELLGV